MREMREREREREREQTTICLRGKVQNTKTLCQKFYKIDLGIGCCYCK
jgi:hypothetical protein